MKRLFFLVCLIILNGCSKDIHNYYPEEKFVSYGAVNEVKTVLAGDSIMHVQKEIITDILEVTKHIHEYNISIPKGSYVKLGEDADNIYFSPETLKGRKVTISNTPLESGWIVFRKSDNKFYPDADGTISFVSFSDGKILRNQRTKLINQDFLYRSIDYGGSKKNLVRFIYREGDNIQNLTHNMNDSKIFSYQGAKVEIITYDNDTLTYKILEPLDIFD